MRHSQADFSKAIDSLGYVPQYRLLEGIHEAMPWYIKILLNLHEKLGGY